MLPFPLVQPTGAVETEVDKARFLNLLAGALIDPKNEVQVVDMLKD